MSQATALQPALGALPWVRSPSPPGGRQGPEGEQVGRGLHGAPGPGSHVPKLSSMALPRGARGRRSPRAHTAARSPSAASSFSPAGTPRCRRGSRSPSGSSTWMEKGWCWRCCSPAAAPWPSQPPRAACGESGRQSRALTAPAAAAPSTPSRSRRSPLTCSGIPARCCAPRSSPSATRVPAAGSGAAALPAAGGGTFSWFSGSASMAAAGAGGGARRRGRRGRDGGAGDGRAWSRPRRSSSPRLLNRPMGERGVTAAPDGADRGTDGQTRADAEGGEPTGRERGCRGQQAPRPPKGRREELRAFPPGNVCGKRAGACPAGLPNVSRELGGGVFGRDKGRFRGRPHRPLQLSETRG